MTTIVNIHGVAHNVSTHYLTDGGDFIVVHTFCGHHDKASVFALDPKPGIPTCLQCVVAYHVLMATLEGVDIGGWGIDP